MIRSWLQQSRGFLGFLLLCSACFGPPWRTGTRFRPARCTGSAGRRRGVRQPAGLQRQDPADRRGARSHRRAAARRHRDLFLAGRRPQADQAHRGAARGYRADARAPPGHQRPEARSTGSTVDERDRPAGQPSLAANASGGFDARRHEIEWNQSRALPPTSVRSRFRRSLSDARGQPDNSADSRFFGPVGRERLIGRAERILVSRRSWITGSRACRDSGRSCNDRLRNGRIRGSHLDHGLSSYPRRG